MSLASEHQRLLVESAIDIEVAEAGGVRSVRSVDQLPDPFKWCRTAPGIVFPHRSPAGVIVEQYRPDKPVTVDGEDRARKYLFPKNANPVINVHPAMNGKLNTASRIVVVEGTKQHLAAVTAAAGLDVAVVGIAGCYGWSSNSNPISDLGLIPWAGRDVVVIFDADIATNINVHTAATRFADELELRGADLVKFVTLPGGGNAGLDDVLASRAVDGATSLVFSRLVDKAGKLPKKPAAKNNTFFGTEGLMVIKVITAIRDQHHIATDPGQRLLVYRDGVYVDGTHAITAAIGGLLGDGYRPMHARAVIELLTAQLIDDGKVVPEAPERALVNLRNGLLDPFTGMLTDHTPDHLSLVQFPVEWDPNATCPTFNRWLDEAADGRDDDLLEAAAQVLDMRGHRQRKAVFGVGPTRSGKSTFARLVEAIVGPDATSAVTLHELCTNRFASSDLYGMALNSAADLSAQHVDDVSLFKRVTGDDTMRAERKYGHAFKFRNRALFMFTANEVPTVAEVSGAYLTRIRPYLFPHSYEGREDPTIEAAMLLELPGILVRLVDALRRFEDRGGYLDDERSKAALADFARHSDRVRLFLWESTRDNPDGLVERGLLFEAFERWVQANRRQSMSRQRFYETVDVAGYRPVKRHGNRGFVGLELRPEHDWGPPDDPVIVDLDVGGGQKGQNIPTPASREEVGGDEEQVLVKAGCNKPAPSAPRPSPRRKPTTAKSHEKRFLGPMPAWPGVDDKPTTNNTFTVCTVCNKTTFDPAVNVCTAPDCAGF